jgi:hypothetical protein
LEVKNKMSDMGSQSKKVVYELVTAFVVILLLIVMRPLFVGQVGNAQSPYTITLTNGSTQTITPSSTISTTQTDTIYSVVIFLVALIALIVILLTVAGKL